jgi:hypothetical protein
MSKTADTSNPDPLDEIIAEYLTRLEAHDPPQPAELIERNPEFAEQLREFFADKLQIDDWAVASRKMRGTGWASGGSS